MNNETIHDHSLIQINLYAAFTWYQSLVGSQFLGIVWIRIPAVTTQSNMLMMVSQKQANRVADQYLLSFDSNQISSWLAKFFL